MMIVLCFGRQASRGRLRLIKKKAQEFLAPFGNRTPGNNRYRCFLSDLAGLAALPPPGSRRRGSGNNSRSFFFYPPETVVVNAAMPRNDGKFWKIVTGSAGGRNSSELRPFHSCKSTRLQKPSFFQIFMPERVMVLRMMFRNESRTL